MDKTIDLRGLTCPEPVLKTKALLDDPAVQKVEALVDGEVNVNNLSRLSRSLKLKFDSEKLETHFKVTLERGELVDNRSVKQSDSSSSSSSKSAGEAGLKTSDDANLAKPAAGRAASEHAHYPVASPTHISESDEKVGTVVFLGKDKFGEGDAEFSTTLISLFLQTMLASGHRPRAILLANTGVKLMGKQSSSLKVLNDFKEAGVEVLACGLCVEFYKLKEEIPSAQITNMFAICEYMFAADKVISP
jgi:selenium metabolism protein YedF